MIKYVILALSGVHFASLERAVCLSPKCTQESNFISVNDSHILCQISLKFQKKGY